MDKATPAKWIALRSVEREFQSFLAVCSKEEAVAAATLRCKDATGEISLATFDKFKLEYLVYFRASLGIPANATTAVL